jgi:DNA primase
LGSAAITAADRRSFGVCQAASEFMMMVPMAASTDISHALPPRHEAGPLGGDDTKERVREAIDIVDLIGSYISLRRNGRNLVGLCPWHDDSRPSLQINPERQTFRCWVCNIGGDAFSFLMRMERLEFREALEQLAERAGIDLPKSRGPGGDVKRPLFETVAWAAARFSECLQSSPLAAKARAYLADRGLTAETVAAHGLGFVPDEWDWLLRQAQAAGVATGKLEQAGLAVPRQDRSGHYDRFRGRVMFPIRDPQGRHVAFGGRVLPGSPPDAAKYINSPETAIFSKQSMLYGLETARETMSRSRRAVVVEGYTDCLAARQAGIGDVVAVLGTALGQRHARLLRRYADRIVVVLDGDDAGRRRADEVLEVLLAEPIDVRIASLPNDVDPCDFCLNEGSEAFEALLSTAVDPLDYRMQRVVDSLPADASDDTALTAVEGVLSVMAAVSPRSPLPPSQRQLREDQLLGRLCRRFGLSREALQARLAELARARSSNSAPLAEGEDEPFDARSLPAWDRELLEAIVAAPEAIGPLLQQVSDAELETEVARLVLAAAVTLQAAGREPTLASLLLELTDPRLHGLLVQLDESTREQTHLDQTDRVHHLDAAITRRRADRTARQNLRTLKTSPLQPDDEAAILEQLVAARRAAQGMTDPKEG